MALEKEMETYEKRAPASIYPWYRREGSRRREQFPIHTPSTQAQAHLADQFDVSLILQQLNVGRVFNAIPVVGTILADHGIQCLVGRDILRFCLFNCDGQAGFFSLAF